MNTLMSEPCSTRPPPNLPMQNHMLSTIILIVILLAVIGSLPNWPHSRNWGYAPSGLLTVVVIVLLVLVLTGRM
jgi:hypothetical protein